ncbi:hypothetical protein DVH24_019888 [Malus domestica]|uniref:PB1-like domain-containing protein n=1 Tax=Malus domestica TaxID=3750 RepID=A0A498I1K9_MALDO|nr:hypothetical protein DVH24_019888 [Malus domestica]
MLGCENRNPINFHRNYLRKEGDDEIFTIKMYHGGELSDDFYVKGKVDFFFFCDKDLMSLLEVHNIVEELGYGNLFMSYHYRFSGMEIQNGLKPLKIDSYVINTCKFVPKHIMIDVYIKKIIPEECASQEINFIKSIEPVTQTSVVIQEINGDEDDQKRLGKLAIEYPISGLDEFHGDEVLASIRAQDNQQGEGFEQQMIFEQEIDVDVSKPDYNLDSIRSVHEDRDGYQNNNELYHEFNEKTDMKNPHLSIGLIFRDVAQFRRAIVMHASSSAQEATSSNRGGVPKLRTAPFVLLC